MEIESAGGLTVEIANEKRWIRAVGGIVIVLVLSRELRAQESMFLLGHPGNDGKLLRPRARIDLVEEWLVLHLHGAKTRVGRHETTRRLVNTGPLSWCAGELYSRVSAMHRGKYAKGSMQMFAYFAPRVKGHISSGCPASFRNLPVPPYVGPPGRLYHC